MRYAGQRQAAPPSRAIISIRSSIRGCGIAKQKVNPKLILAAALLLAGLCLWVGYRMAAERVELLEQGRRTDGVVVDIDVGVKGLRAVEAEFIAADGRRRVGLDIHKTQWFAANEVGDEVVLYYDPLYEGDGKPNILIERGLWIWSIPAFLLVGGVLLLWLGWYLSRQPRKNGDK